MGAKQVDEGYEHKQKLGYWGIRSNFMYYKYVDYLVRALAADAKSLIDVGSKNTQYIENFHWIPKRNTLDISKPYSSENVTGIEMDFFDFEPEENYDFATCLQVLEHIPDAKSFARKLFEIADRVLISVPYKWEKDSHRLHVHDPVDLDKLLSWTGRQPSYSIVVEEPLSRSPKRNRLICYYHSEGEKFDPGAYYETLQKQLREQLETSEAQMKLLEKEPKARRESNNALRKRLNKRNSELKKMREKRRETIRERDRFRWLYAEIRQSRFWRYILPVRKIAGTVRSKVTRRPGGGPGT